MAPGSIFHYIILPPTSYFCCRLLCNLYFPTYSTKIPKIFILLSLSDLTFASGHEGTDNPFITLVVRFLFVCAGTRDLRVISYWIDTLVLKNWGKYLLYYCCITLSSSRKTNASSRCSISPLVVLCERRLHDTSPLFGPRGRHWEVISRLWVARVTEA